uniref:Uncharacterized protein n=1 Tax=Cacopsylla melanoneura TaxID=428564 RepID=A0A8D8Z7U5_9HEMI
MYDLFCRRTYITYLVLWTSFFLLFSCSGTAFALFQRRLYTGSITQSRRSRSTSITKHVNSIYSQHRTPVHKWYHIILIELLKQCLYYMAHCGHHIVLWNMGTY